MMYWYFFGILLPGTGFVVPVRLGSRISDVGRESGRMLKQLSDFADLPRAIEH